MFAKKFICIALLLCVLSTPINSSAQQKKNAKPEVSPKGPVLSEHGAIRYEVGVIIQGGPEPCHNLKVIFPVPIDTLEQFVVLDDQSIPASANKVEFREQPGLKQMIVMVPTIRANQEMNFRAIFNLQLSKVQAPSDTSVFVIPKSPSKDVKPYLGISPGINLKHQKIKTALKDMVEGKADAWEEVKGIFEWVNTNIEVDPDGEINDSTQAFLDKKGSPEDVTGLFVGLCRLHKVPARTVWVEGAVQAEFYLVDDEGIGAWFPVKFSGIAEFGSDSNPAIILQKGDNFRVPEKKDALRYVSESLVVTGSAAPNAVRFFGGKLAGIGK